MNGANTGEMEILPRRSLFVDHAEHTRLPAPRISKDTPIPTSPPNVEALKLQGLQPCIAVPSLHGA